MDATLSLLDKKFAHSWSSWSVVAGMNQDTLDQVINGFDKLDKKSKVSLCLKSVGD